MLDRHKRFLEEYMIDGNAKRSYMKIYPNISEDSAKESASRILRRKDIKLELQRMQEERMKNVMWSAEDILQQIKLIFVY